MNFLFYIFIWLKSNRRICSFFWTEERKRNQLNKEIQNGERLFWFHSLKANQRIKKVLEMEKKNVHNMIWISQCVQLQQKSVITSRTHSFYRWRNINLKGFIQFHVEPEAELGFLTFSSKSFGLLWILHTELCYGKKLLIILWQDLIFFFLKVFLNIESKE